MRTTRKLAARWTCCAVLAATTLGGCATVAPYERETLAQQEMDVAEREARAEVFRAHVHDSRRGAMSVSGHGGGGCGCN